jgi:hypothetical protein
MSRKKSAASKVNTRREAYKRRSMQCQVHRSWRVLVLVVMATKKFLRFRHSATSERGQVCRAISLKPYSSKHDWSNVDIVAVSSTALLDTNGKLEEFEIIEEIVRKLVSKVSRLDSERRRQSERRKRKCASDDNVTREKALKRHRQSRWFGGKYSNNVSFRSRKIDCVKRKNQVNYENDEEFRVKKIAQSKSHSMIKYRSDILFRTEKKECSNRMKSNKYHNDADFRQAHKNQSRIRILHKYRADSEVRLKMIEYAKKFQQNKVTAMRRTERRVHEQTRRI